MDLNALTKQIIEKSFPELRQRDFHVSPSNNVPYNAFMAACLLEQGDFSIFADKFSESYPEETIKRALAHELAHIARSVKRWRITERLSKQLYHYFSFYRNYEERRTEQLAASRGYETPNI